VSRGSGFLSVGGAMSAVRYHEGVRTGWWQERTRQQLRREDGRSEVEVRLGCDAVQGCWHGPRLCGGAEGVETTANAEDTEDPEGREVQQVQRKQNVPRESVSFLI